MNKAYTDIEQSRKLAEILPIESADMGWDVFVDNSARCLPINDWDLHKDGSNGVKFIPAWSLAALLSVFSLPRLMLDEQEDGERGWLVSHYTDDTRYDSYYRDEPIDACYNLILQLKEKDLL